MSYDEDVQTGYTGGLNAAKELSSLGPRALSIRRKLELHKKQHEEQIAHLDELLKLLDENPAIEKFQNLSAKVSI